MQEDYERRYWTGKWNVSRKQQLAAAVREVEVSMMAATWRRNLANPPESAPLRGRRALRGLGVPLQRKDWLHLLTYASIAVLSIAILVNNFR